MADIIDELAALEAFSAQAMTTAPATPAAPVVTQPDPVPGSTVNVEVALNQPAPAPAPQPAPQPEPAPQPAPEPQPAPQPAPPEGVVIPDKTPRRVYAHPGMTEENKLLLSLIDANPGLSLDAIMAAASTQLGKPVITPPAPTLPQAPNPEAPQPQPAPSNEPLTHQSAEQRLDQIAQQFEQLDPVIHADEWKRLTIEQNKLVRALPKLALQAEQQQLAVAQQEDQIIAATRAAVTQDYPAITPQVIDTIFDTAQPLSAIQDPFAQAVAVRMRQDIATNSPLLDAPDYEALVVAAVAQQQGILPQRRPQATSPQAANTPPAAPAPQPTPQNPHAGHQPLQVMPAVPGSQHTSADRVTTVPPNPQANLQQEYAQAVAANDFAAIERISGLMAAGGNAPAQAPMPAQVISISYSGQAA